MLNDHYTTLVIGAGQAGLAAGYYLNQQGADFLLLDAATEVGSSWRRRWDSLRLFTPNRYNALPGTSFPGPPGGLSGKDDVANYLRDYVARFRLPVSLETSVSVLERGTDRFRITTSRGVVTADTIVVATGAYHQPHVPSFAADLPRDVVQRHSSEYRNPAALPPGAVLVVGAGNSGAQIALELARDRRVWLSGRDTGALPRRLLGRDVYDWLWPTVMRPTTESWLGRRLMAGRLFAGDPLVGIAARDLAVPNLTRISKATGVRDGQLQFEHGEAIPRLAAVIWCTGFRPRFDWIHLPILGADGYPMHRRGLLPETPGLAFLGLRYQYRVGSSLLGGVGEDAAFVVSALDRERRRAA